jgi:hypothetical protein
MKPNPNPATVRKCRIYRVADIQEKPRTVLSEVLTVLRCIDGDNIGGAQWRLEELALRLADNSVLLPPLDYESLGPHFGPRQKQALQELKARESKIDAPIFGS